MFTYISLSMVLIICLEAQHFLIISVHFEVTYSIQYYTILYYYIYKFITVIYHLYHYNLLWDLKCNPFIKGIDFNDFIEFVLWILYFKIVSICFWDELVDFLRDRLMWILLARLGRHANEWWMFICFNIWGY